MTTNKVCGKGKCKFTDEFCASGDCPYDPDVLKKQKKINISEGNVKEDDINVAKNVAQRNSQDLTEQWKKGELEEGYYYTQYNPIMGKPFVEIELRNYLLDLAKVRDADTVKIITPVPNYEKWKSLNEILDSSLQTNKALAHRLNLCKELLKECRDEMNHYIELFTHKKTFEVLLTKIDEVLK